MPGRFVVIGGDAAGMSAAAQLRRLVPRSQLEIVVFEKGPYTSYSACGLPFFVSGLVEDAESLIARTPEEHIANGIDVRMLTEVVSVDLERREVEARTVDGKRTGTRVGFDQLLFATGATPIRPDLPNASAHGIHGIQSLTDGIRLRDAVVRAGRPKVVVVGGGYVGLEMAEAMRVRDLDVVLVDRAAQPMSTLDEDMGALVARALEGLGVELRLGTAVEAFEADGEGRVRGVVTDAGTLDADLVVLGIGVRPNSTLAAHAGVPIGRTGGISTDLRMSTNVDGVWAAGDCVETLHRLTGEPVAIALGTHANKQGRVVAANAAGKHATFRGVIGTAVTKVCDLEVARTGLNEREATHAGIETVSGVIEGTSRAGYYPGAQRLHVKVRADARTGRLLGAQIVGREGAAKRIDVFAAAIWTGMTADEFSQLDLGYAPPYAPLWDPTLIGARKAAEAVATASTPPPAGE
jgi:NADPH-dependent 2,4-dienoyl-CoA reductase/sulfur reductase-like enzyme